MKPPKPLSEGEELLALHLKCAGIPFEREVCLVLGRKYRWDFVCGNDLAIEVQGGTWRKGAHSSGTGLARDYRKANAAAIAGYRTLFFSTAQVKVRRGSGDDRGGIKVGKGQLTSG